MAKAIFRAPFNYSARKSNAGWSIAAEAEPQTFPEEVIAAAIAAGVADRVPPARATPKRSRAATAGDNAALNQE